MDECSVEDCPFIDDIEFCENCGKEFCPEHFEKHYEACLDEFIAKEDMYYA